MGILNIKAPTGGISRQTGFQSQPPFTTFKSINMWPKDVISGRLVSASRPPLVEFPSPGSSGAPVNMLANVNGDATQDPQFSMLSARNGTAYWYNGTDWTPVVSSSTVTTGRAVASHAFLKRVLVMNNTTAPLVFNYDDLTMVPLVASVGTVPVDCRIVTAAFGAIWIAGALETPHVFSASRTGNIFDWDFSVANTDLGGAYTSTGEDEGFILEPITAMFRLNSDTVIIACVDEMWAMRGHPRRGGLIEKLPEKIGILGFGACARGPNGEVYFLSRLGVGVLDETGSRPTLLSKKVIPTDLVGLAYDYTNPNVCLEYNPLWNGVHITVRGDEAQAWWMDLNDKISFHEDQYSEHPHVTTWFGSIETEAAAGVLFAGDNGITRFDSLGTEDFASELLTGPFRMSESDMVQSYVRQTDYRFLDGTTDSDTSTVEMITGANGDDVISRYLNELPNFRARTTMDKLLRNGGRTRPLLAGSAGLYVMQAFGGDRIVFEGAENLIEDHGKNIFVPKRTEFEEPSTALVIGTGWTVGGVHVEATGGTPSANLNDFSLWIDLSDIAADGWWDAVAVDGRDIRVTTNNNALRPIDLIPNTFNRGARTGWLVVRHSLVNAVAPVMRVWCGNPLASVAPAGGPYGQYNAYPSDCICFAPVGGGQDRTRYKHHFVAQGGVVFGGAAGPQSYMAGTRYAYGGDDLGAELVFSTTTTDADPGAGKIRLDTVTQSSVTILRVDLLDNEGNDITADLDAADDLFRLVKANDITKFIRCNHVSTATPSGYRNITVNLVTASEANPFLDADVVKLCIEREFDTEHLRPNAVCLLPTPLSVTNATIIVLKNIQDTDDAAGSPVGFDVGLWESASSTDFLSMRSTITVSPAFALSFSAFAEGNGVNLSASLTAMGDLGDYFHYAFTASSTAGYALYKNGSSVSTSAENAGALAIDEIRIAQVSAAFVANTESEVAQDIAAVQVFNTTKTSTFIAYNYSLVDQAAFWSAWTLG